MRIIKGFKLRKMGSEYMVVGEGLGQVNFNKLISLNLSAAYLWQQIEEKEFTPEILAGLLIERYGIDSETAWSDANDIIKDWMNVKIVE